jgi:protein involved in ribonucleotide reduction
MLVAYASMTGNVRRFVGNLDFPSFDISKNHGVSAVYEPFVLITYTTGQGQVPKEVERFIETNSIYLKAVIGSGNRNWGDKFCGGAEKIADKYNVPLLHTFEMFGFPSDVGFVTNKIIELQEGMRSFGKVY